MSESINDIREDIDKDWLSENLGRYRKMTKTEVKEK